MIKSNSMVTEKTCQNCGNEACKKLYSALGGNIAEMRACNDWSVESYQKDKGPKELRG